MRVLHCLYTLTEKFKRWLVMRFTRLGRLLLLVAAVSFLFGVNTERTMIYQIFALVFCSLLFSFISTLRFSPGLKITRYLPGTCVVGRPLRYRVAVENLSKKVVRGLFYEEYTATPLPDFSEFASSKEDGEERRNIFDRKMGYYRWLWLIGQTMRFGPVANELTASTPGGREVCDVSLLPLKRGSMRLAGHRLIRVDPLGLCKSSVVGGAGAKILVYPKLYNLPPLKFTGSRRYHQGGISMAQERGDSTEFFSLREYSYGDPLKHIDWKGTARSGAVIVRQYRDEYFSRYGLVLDGFSPLRNCDRFEEAVSIAASILMAQESINSVIDLLFFGGNCHTATMGMGLGEREQMMEILASVSTCPDEGFEVMSALLRHHLHLLSGVVFVLIDIDEERKRLIRYVAANKIPVKIILVVSGGEEEGADLEKTLGVPVRRVAIGRVQEDLQRL